MTNTTPVTEEELKAAYQNTDFPECGVSYQYCMDTRCVKKCLTNLAISMRKRTDPAIPPARKRWYQIGQYA